MSTPAMDRVSGSAGLQMQLALEGEPIQYKAHGAEDYETITAIVLRGQLRRRPTDGNNRVVQETHLIVSKASVPQVRVNSDTVMLALRPGGAASVLRISEVLSGDADAWTLVAG